jgi:hypothetical protein
MTDRARPSGCERENYAVRYPHSGDASGQTGGLGALLRRTSHCPAQER